MYNCPKCHTPFELGTKFCQHCGYDLASNFLSEPVCPTCKKEFPSGAKFCDKDGCSLVTKDKLIPKCIKCGKEYADSVKFCPDDGGAIVAEAYRSQTFPSKMLNGTLQGKNTQPSSDKLNNSGNGKTIDLQFTWFTWLLWGSLVAGIIGEGFSVDGLRVGGVFTTIGFLALVVALIIGWVLQYRAWSTIQSINPRTTPSKAIGFQFIPFFNLYWVFVAYYGLSQDINRFIEINQLSISKFDERIGLATPILYCSLPIIIIVFGFILSTLPSNHAMLVIIPTLLSLIVQIASTLISFLFTKEVKNTLLALLNNK